VVGLRSPEVPFPPEAIRQGNGAAEQGMRSNNYTIHHLDLSQEVKALPEGGTLGFYLVFWFRSIPLGELYIDQNRCATSEDLIQLALKATAPSIKHYCQQCLVRPLVPASIEELRAICEQVVAKIEPPNFPQVCDVSVVICTRNRPHSLRNCLTALHRQHTRPAEIIVVDNGSVTNDTEKVCSEFNNIKYVREDRVGLDIARNTGARASQSSIVAYTDDDTLPDPNWVYRIHESFQKKDVVAITGLVLAGSLRTEAEVIFEKHWPFNRGFVHKLFDQSFFNDKLPSGPPVWEIGAGANMAFKREIFEDVGYFDERLDVGAAGCSGDSELWYRILANGFTIVYNPLAIVSHYHRDSLPGLKRQLYAYMRGFTVAILIQHERFGHKGNLHHLLRVIPTYYMGLILKGFPYYKSQYQTLFSEMRGILSGMFYYIRHRNTNPGIYGHETF
jgi:GT2 family glycosyltransferase